jgi:hypothetical protein
MPDRHACPLCDFSREAEQATVLDPSCPRCGGMLRPAARAAEAPRDRLGDLARRRWVERTALAILILPLILGSAKLGFSAGGGALAVASLLVASLTAYVAITPPGRHR